MNDESKIAELKAVIAEMEAFNYTMVHDLKNPMIGISGLANILSDDYSKYLPEEGQRYIGLIQKSTKKMGLLIEGLLRLSRIGNAVINRESFDMTRSANDIAEKLKRLSPDRAVTFVIAEGLVVWGDGTLLQTALSILIHNSWKYTSRHATARIELGVVLHEGQNRYFVRDDGAGFDMNYAKNLLRPFVRLHGESEFEGNGIGLATVDKIIKRHGGTVLAEAVVEGGATITFTLGE